MSQTPPNLVSLAVLAGMFGVKHFLHITIGAPHQFDLVIHNQVQKIVNSADDWLRYSESSWIIWTNESPEQWYKKLAEVPLLKEASILILKVDVSRQNRAGQLPDWAWQWLDRNR